MMTQAAIEAALTPMRELRDRLAREIKAGAKIGAYLPCPTCAQALRVFRGRHSGRWFAVHLQPTSCANAAAKWIAGDLEKLRRLFGVEGVLRADARGANE